MKKLLNFSALFLFSVLFQLSVFGQNSGALWQKTSDVSKKSSKKLERKSTPKEFESFYLNENLLLEKLSNAPQRGVSNDKSNVQIEFPVANGKFEAFQIFEASIMEPSLQKKYSNIKSYLGKSVSNPAKTIRFSVSPDGFYGMIFNSEEGTIFIDPYSQNSNDYIVYSKNSLPVLKDFVCGFDEMPENKKQPNVTISAKANNANDGVLRTFRLAIATTGEYSLFHTNRQGIPATATDAEKKAGVLAAINTTMTRVNGIFERDLGLTMVLVANNTDVIFLDAATDGFTNNDASTLINESQSKIDGIIGAANYDIGHTFSTGGGGLAQLNSPCTSSKARGITGSSQPVGDAYDIDFVAHEMGHQYGARHTFNADSGGCGGGNRSNATAVEPGSGSTIMAYAGLCAPNNIQNLSDSYFHLVSINEMWNNLTNGNSTCSVNTATGNNAPVLQDLTAYTLPISTPFIIKAEATDVNGDNLTYTVEQLDTEIAPHPLVSTATGGPAFRSLPPSNSNFRSFPKIETVLLGNTSTTWEVLPSVTRTMRFGVNVRDNNLNGGQTASKGVTISFNENAGPFKITSQSAPETWEAGTVRTVTWDVANTNQTPINCNFVNILLSTDGGNTFPITIAANIPNDGTEEIIVPNTTTLLGRIKIESVGNIFYSVNTRNITINSSEFIMTFTDNFEEVCAPNSVTYNFVYNTFNGFNETTTFSASNNPTGTTVSFNPSTATADNTPVQVTISNITDSSVGLNNTYIKGTASSTNKTSVVKLNVYSATVNAPTLISPENNATNVPAPFLLEWNKDTNALSYTVQISEDNSFATILDQATVTETTYASELIQPNTNYFWRVKAINNCGESSFSDAFSFSTENNTCNVFAATDVPVSIPDNSTVGATSKINITENVKISDLNVKVTIPHEWMGDLTLSLISPDNLSVTLVANLGDEQDGFINTVFDNEASTSISFGDAPYTGTFKPVGNLSNFYNKNSFGEWKLKVVDGGPADIGTIENWSLEICGVPTNINVFSVEAISETCPNKNNGKIIITPQVTKNYTATLNGTAYPFSTETTISNLAPGVYSLCITVEGESYEQCYSVTIGQGTIVSGKASVNSGKMAIAIDKGTAPFTVFVNNKEQFETYAPEFSVDVFVGDLVQVKTAIDCEGVFEQKAEGIAKLVAYPNPTNGIFEIRIPSEQKNVVVEIYSIIGQLVSSTNYNVINNKIAIDISNKPKGLYIVKAMLQEPVTVKIIKQ